MKKELLEKEHQLGVKPTKKAADGELSWLNVLSQETGENVQERMNLQALFELEETKIGVMDWCSSILNDATAKRQVGDLTNQF
jgi:kinesin family member 18/19